jgi:hypothetical protein
MMVERVVNGVMEQLNKRLNLNVKDVPDAEREL